MARVLNKAAGKVVENTMTLQEIRQVFLLVP